MTTLKRSHWTTLLHFCNVYGALLLCQISKVQSQCIDGYELGCIWTHDEKAPLRWVTETVGGQNFVRLTGCAAKECGTAVMLSPWIEPRERDVKLIFRYKLYGTSNVYLRLYLKTDDGKQQTLFSKAGNYKLTFPEEWSARNITLPATPSHHRLLLKANIPYPEAYVAVGGFSIEGSIPILSTVVTTTTTTEPPPPEDTTTTPPPSTTEEAQTTTTEKLFFHHLPDFPGESEEEDEEGRSDLYREEEGRHEVEELKKGYTRTMDPNICKYSRKLKKMKWS